MNNNNSVDFIEVVFARSEGQRGRFLRIGQEDEELFLVINEAITNRFGANGVIEVIDSDGYWLGLPILSKDELKYYLLGTFEKPSEEDRGAPFHGCLLTADKLKEKNYNLRPFINAWSKLKNEDNQNSSWLSQDTAGKVKLDLETDLEPEQLNDSELIEEYFSSLEQGNLVRLPFKKTVFSLLNLKISTLFALSRYSWSTAPFAFPSDHDGAQLHIALSNNGGSLSTKEAIKPLLLRDKIDVGVDKTGKPNPAPIKKSPLISNTVNPLEEFLKSTFASIKSVLTSKTIKFFIIAVVIIPIVIVFINLNQDNATNPEYIARRLDPSNELSLDEDIKSVEETQAFLNNQQVNEDSKKRIKSQDLVTLRVSRTQKRVKELVNQDYESLFKLPVSNWILVTKTLPNGEKLLQDLVISATPSIEKSLNIISKITNPDTNSLNQLQSIIKIIENYNYSELSSLKKTASDTNSWFKASMSASENNKNPSTSYSVLSTFIQDNPNSNFSSQAHDLQQKYLASWQQEATTNLKTFYESMIWQAGESPIDIDFNRLTNEISEYQKIPGIQMSKNSEISQTLNEIKITGKTINLVIEQFNFKEKLNEKLDEINCRESRTPQENTSGSRETLFGLPSIEDVKKALKPCPKNDHTVELVVDGYSSRTIQNDSRSTISVLVSFNGNTSISIQKQGERLAIAELPGHIIEFWLKNQGINNKITFNELATATFNELATATYKTPTPDEMGFPHWR